MKLREHLNAAASAEQLLTEMSEGNNGAEVILDKMIGSGGSQGALAIEILDDMNIRGSQIFIAYNGYANGDLDVFLTAIRDRKQPMIDYVNIEIQALRHVFERENKAVPKAISKGASEMLPRPVFSKP